MPGWQHVLEHESGRTKQLAPGGGGQLTVYKTALLAQQSEYELPQANSAVTLLHHCPLITGAQGLKRVKELSLQHLLSSNCQHPFCPAAKAPLRIRASRYCWLRGNSEGQQESQRVRLQPSRGLGSVFGVVKSGTVLFLCLSCELLHGYRF